MIYAIGGDHGTNGSDLSTVEEYNPATNTWRTTADMPTPLTQLAAVAANNGKIYAIGGSVTTGEGMLGLRTVEEYDPVTDSWTAKTDMLTPRANFSTSVVNGKIYELQGMMSLAFQKWKNTTRRRILGQKELA